MDPNTCLEELRKLLAKYKQQKDQLDETDVQDLVIRAEALDDWMSKGGAMPGAWTRYRDEPQSDPSEVEAAKKEVADGLAEFNDENPEFPGKRSIESFYEAVRTLHKAGRIR